MLPPFAKQSQQPRFQLKLFTVGTSFSQQNVFKENDETPTDLQTKFVTHLSSFTELKAGDALIIHTLDDRW